MQYKQNLDQTFTFHNLKLQTQQFIIIVLPQKIVSEIETGNF